MREGSRRAVVAALFANFGIAAAKFLAFAVTGSASLLAEAIHSVADTGNQGLLFLGARRAQRPPTAAHPFGYGRERFFWAFVVALVLFSMGSVFALVEGVDKVLHPHKVEDAEWAFAVLGLSIGLETFSLRTAVRESAVARGTSSWWDFVRHAKTPELVVVLLEDTGALTGLFFAVIGVTVAVTTGDGIYDATGSLAIGVLLGLIAYVLAREMKSLLIGEAASPAEEGQIRAVLDDCPEVKRVIHLRTQHLGPEELLVAAKVEFATDSVAELADAIDRVEARIRSRVPTARLIYLEPDVYRPEPAPTDS